MAVQTDVFQRVEKKYRVSAHQRRCVEEALREHMAPDDFGLVRVTSLYFDTPDHALIERSLEKPLYKEKLRVRAYGDAAGRALMAAFAAQDVAAGAVAAGSAGVCDSEAAVGAAGTYDSEDSIPVFVELKKKFKGVVYKRRVCMSLAAACAYLQEGSSVDYVKACEQFPLADVSACGMLPARSVQIAHEIDAARARWPHLSPAMGIVCDRVAWAPCEQVAFGSSDLRVTFDSALSYCDLRKQLGESNAWHPVIDAGESIMEIKCAGAYPLWLAQILTSAQVRPSSFSKYGTAYRKGARCA